MPSKKRAVEKSVAPDRPRKKTTGKSAALRMAHGVDRLPGDDHGHHSRFASAGRQFQSQAQQLRIGIVIGIFEVFKKPSSLTQIGCHFGQPDQRLHGFDLAEKRANTAKGIRAPMLQQPSGFRCHAPVIWIGKQPPLVNASAQLVDDWRGVILLLRTRKPLAFIKDHFLLQAGSFALLGLWDRCDEFSRARRSRILCVGCPCSSSSQWRLGYS